jgi:hypothetical protein
MAKQHEQTATVTMAAPQSGQDGLNHRAGTGAEGSGGQGSGAGNADHRSPEQQPTTLANESTRVTASSAQTVSGSMSTGVRAPTAGAYISVLA